MRQAHDDVSARMKRALRRGRAPLALGVMAALVASAGRADAQVGSANVPLPNVMLLLDTSGSFEHMIDGSNPEDLGPGPYNTNPMGNNDTTNNLYANCETAWNQVPPVAAIPNRWGVAMQALTGTVLNAAGTPFYSCVTMDRATGQPPIQVPGVPGPLATTITTAAQANGLDLQYGIRDESGHFNVPYDSGYYLPFHRPVAQTSGGRCVVSPNLLPGAIIGGVGQMPGTGAPGPLDCPNESGPCLATDFPTDAIGSFLYDKYPIGLPLPTTLLGANVGYSSNTTSCNFNQANDGIIDQASTLVRFGLMTFDNDPSELVGVTFPAAVPTQPGSPFIGQWSYDSVWDPTCATGPQSTPSPFTSPSKGLLEGCTTGAQMFELGARNPAAPPWEGRLLGFPNPNADVNATGQSNAQVESVIRSLRPYGATPTAGLMADAEYYFWGDPTGPAGATPDPFVAGGCRSQYIILLTDGQPNQDLRPSCQGSGGRCPYQLPEDTASVLANGAADTVTGLSPRGKVYTYVIGFAVSGNVNGADTGSANCQQLAAAGTLDTMCQTGQPYSATDTSPNPITPLPQQQDAQVGTTPESPCCSLQRVAVAGGTQHAYFADTPGDLNAALAAVLGDITGQLGSRTLPVASPTISYAAGAPLTASYLATFQAATCQNQNADGTCNTPWQSNGPWTGDVERQQYTCPGGGLGATPSAPVAADDFGADLASQTSRNFLFFSGSNSTTSPTVSTNALTIRPYLNSAHAITNNVGVVPALDNLDAFGALQTGLEISNFGQGSETSIYSALNINNGIALNIQPTSCQDPFSAGYLDRASCANLALSFAMAQPTFAPVLTGGAASLLAGAYAMGTDGTNAVQPTNRFAHPLGAILDSTPQVVATPSAQVRDDSYQAFATALSPATLGGAGNATRDTMMYVASIDGLLHAFDTSAGIASLPPNSNIPATAVESWAFIPPAVLPHLISSYPGASSILLDGAPVVKDVVFSRCTTPGAVCGNPPSGQWVTDWHTMLVAGFGQGGRGYYALDVTDPRPPSSPTVPTYTAPGYPTFVASGAPALLTGTGPHFQWQITSVNLTGEATVPAGLVPNELFGKISATPAITTVYADPVLPTPGTNVAPQEIGVAILPGGRDGLPTATGTCPRELEVNAGNYNTTAPLYQPSGQAGKTLPSNSPFNVSDPNFPPRVNVRSWAKNCSGPNSAVAGRSVMVVAVATGQILAVFARAPSSGYTVDVTKPTAWDVPTDGFGNTLITPTYLNYTPLDSPMTGTPVVYPSGVGVVAQAAYIGDADGTMWRFDLSDPNPRNWTGAIFADAYSPAADLSGGDAYPASVTDFTALDSEAISVEPQLALDPSANVVMNFATGDQTAFNACYSSAAAKGTNLTTSTSCTGALQPTVNFLYSVHEKRNTSSGSSAPPYLAQVNWYQEWTTGERVTGPMATFNSILYFSTYLPPGGSADNCTGGGANLYAWDFVNPSTAPCGALGDSGSPVGCGGLAGLDQNFPASGELTYTALTTEASGTLTSTTVVPGVSIASTPSCTTAVTNGIPTDAYTGGGHTTLSTPSPGTYSLVANIGKGKNSVSQNLVTQKLKTPSAPTVVDSWASIAE
jgi:type IV pilus assembly protein PilY1